MKTPKTYTLTKAEIQIMNILWEMPEGGCVHTLRRTEASLYHHCHLYENPTQQKVRRVSQNDR